MADTRLILHVKGTQAETAELPKEVVRAAISQGDLTLSQLIWSKSDHAWKQAKEFPELLPVPLNAAASVPRVAVPVARVAVAQPQPKVATARVATARVAAAQPQVGATGTPVPVPARQLQVAPAPSGRVSAPNPVQSSSSSGRSFVVKEEGDDSHPVKWLCIGMGILVAVVSAVNYFLVDQPLASNLRQTSYGNAPVYAHFGAFFQPSVIVIHLPVSSAITEDNLADFLVNLAASTPDSPVGHEAFARVALTSGWTAQYSFAGYSWKELGDMKNDSKAAREEFLLTQMGDAGGDSLLPASTLSESAQEAARSRVWKTFVANFTANK